MPLTTMMAVGARVRAERRAQGLSQTELANRMGVTQAWVSRLESGGTRLAAQLVLDAFVALNIPLEAASRDEAGDDDPFADVRRRVLDQ